VSRWATQRLTTATALAGEAAKPPFGRYLEIVRHFL